MKSKRRTHKKVISTNFRLGQTRKIGFCTVSTFVLLLGAAGVSTQAEASTLEGSAQISAIESVSSSTEMPAIIASASAPDSSVSAPPLPVSLSSLAVSLEEGSTILAIPATPISTSLALSSVEVSMSSTASFPSTASMSATSSDSVSSFAVAAQQNISPSLIASNVASAADSSSVAEQNGSLFLNLTTQQFLSLAETVMDVSVPYSGGTPVVIGDTVYDNPNQTGQSYKVLSAIDTENPAYSSYGYPDNGFQAFAVAPIINGVVDTTQIIIAFAATNPEEFSNDVITDFEMIIGGVTTFNNGTGVVSGQLSSAQTFTHTIKVDYPSAAIVFTGISLGGYLALAMGAIEELPVMAFEGPDPSNVLTAAQIAFVQAHPDMYYDIRNVFDIAGGYDGNGLNDSVFYNSGFYGIMDSHWLPKFTFNSDGTISSPATPVFGPILNSIMNLPDLLLAPLANTLTTVTNLLTTYLPEMDPVTHAVLEIITSVVKTNVYVGNAITGLASGPINFLAAIF